MVLTLIAWATIVTSAQMVSYDLQITTWHSWLTFSLWLYPSYEPKDNKYFCMSFLSRSRKPISPYDRLAPENRYALYFLLEYLTRAVPLHQMSWALQYLEKAAKYFGMTKNQIEEFKPFFNSYDKIIGYVKSIRDREIYEYMISNCSNIFSLMDGGEEHKRLGQQAYKLYEELGFSYSEGRTIVNKYMYRTDI